MFIILIIKMAVFQDGLKAMSGLAIIVLNWNNAKDTIGCLESLASWHSIKPAIYVVDNASRDHSLQEIELRFPRLTIIKNDENLGFAGGNNVAIKKAMEDGADEVLLLNNDARVAEADVSRLLASLHGRPEIAAIGPRIRTGTNVWAGGYDIGHHADTHIRWSLGMGFNGIKNVEYVPGTVFMIRSSVLEKVGLLDEKYFFSGEIADLCRRIYDAGMVCSVDLGTEAVHEAAGPSSIRDVLHAYYTMRNRFLYIKKHCRSQRISLYGKWIGYCLADIAFSAMKGRRERSKAAMLALFDGLAGRYGDHNDRFLTGD
jgi:GT2 family glycosyltransferase